MSAGDPSRAPTTQDLFLGGKLVIEQPAKGYRAGLDAVLLAAAVRSTGEGELRVLDLGAGVGTAGLCAAARLEGAQVTLLERDPGLAALARANISRNGLAGRVRAIESDVLAKAAEHEAAGLKAGSFHVLLCNPPYLPAGGTSLPADRVTAGALGMPRENLERWVRVMARLSAPGGEMIMIHRADALAAILAATGARFGGLIVLPLLPRAGEAAIRVMVSGIKASRAPLQLSAGLVLHGAGNAFTPIVEGILRRGEPLALR